MKHRNILFAIGMTVVAALAASAWAIGATVQSPDQAAARAAPPSPSVITAPVESRVLTTKVITRADVLPAASVAIDGPTVDAAAEGAAVVTGVFVTRGDQVVAGAHVVEVAGRPVFVFAGSTPTYRTMRPGMIGSDVDQLQSGLTEIGCDAGTSGHFDDATKSCVERLYADAGYETERTSPTEAADLAVAEAAVVDAEDALAVAQLNLWNASLPPSDSAVAAARSAVNDAQRSLDAATTSGQDTGPAREALDIAQASLKELTEKPNTALQLLAVDQQQRAVDRARQALEDLQAVSGPIVPYGEVVFVSTLPARVDAVNAVVGAGPSTDPARRALLVVSSTDLRAHISIPQSDRGLVRAGVTVDLLYEATGETITGTVESIGDELQPSATSATPAYPAVVTADFPAEWSGLNLRATFTSATTDSAALVVPLVAVTSSAAGQTRVQVRDDDGTLRSVDVTTGLTADGFVAIEPANDAQLDVGDRVVVG